MSEETLAAMHTSTQARHIGFCARFIDENKTFGGDVARLSAPPTATTSYIGPLLFISA